MIVLIFTVLVTQIAETPTVSPGSYRPSTGSAHGHFLGMSKNNQAIGKGVNETQVEPKLEKLKNLA